LRFALSLWRQTMINSDVLTDWRPLFLMAAGASPSLTDDAATARVLQPGSIAP
jgi:hypothetical protein